MNDKETKYCDKINSTFVGRKIIEVFYEELNYGTNSSYWEYSSNIHSIDMNLVFRFDNNELVQIMWDNEFYCYGIGFEKLKRIDSREGVKTINVTDNSQWNKLTNKEIKRVSVLWEELHFTKEVILTSDKFVTKDIQMLIQLPQTWEIEIENKKIWISAFEIREGDTNCFMADHLSVFFTFESLQKEMTELRA